jgi:hypothetical protein
MAARMAMERAQISPVPPYSRLVGGLHPEDHMIRRKRLFGILLAAGVKRNAKLLIGRGSDSCDAGVETEDVEPRDRVIRAGTAGFAILVALRPPSLSSEPSR